MIFYLFTFLLFGNLQYYQTEFLKLKLIPKTVATFCLVELSNDDSFQFGLSC